MGGKLDRGITQRLQQPPALVAASLLPTPMNSAGEVFAYRTAWLQRGLRYLRGAQAWKKYRAAVATAPERFPTAFTVPAP